MNSGNRNGFDQIKISHKLDEVIGKAILKATHDKKKKKVRGNFLKVNASIVSIFVIFIVSVNISPAFAEALKEIPIISSMSKALIFHYDTNIVNADKQIIKETKSNKALKTAYKKKILKVSVWNDLDIDLITQNQKKFNQWNVQEW